MKKSTLFLVTLLCFQIGLSQNKLKAFNFLIGNWQGVESGMAGNGIGFRTYTYELGDNFIFVNNQSTFPISDKKPMGEVHRDKGVISYNGNTSTVVFREFFVEGFTNIYELKTDLSSENKFIFITREIENNPGNWVAKLIITKQSDTQFVEEFLIAMDGETFSPFIKNTWTKVK